HQMFVLALVVAVAATGETAEGRILQFDVFNPPDSVNDRGLYQDIYSRSPKNYLPQLDDIGSRVTECHEATHFVNHQLRNESKPHGPSFYFGEGRVIAFKKQPDLRLQDVADEVPEKYRKWAIYKNYLVNQRAYWDDEPLYIFDEWSAYRNATRLGRIERLD